MSLIVIAIVVVAGLVAMAVLLFFVSRQLEKREPYASFMRLRNRAKLRFFRLLLSDPRVPKRVKALPLLLIPYLLMPIDIIPDFIPVLGYLDDVAIVLGTLALIIKLTPRHVIDDLFLQAAVEPGSA